MEKYICVEDMSMKKLQIALFFAGTPPTYFMLRIVGPAGLITSPHSGSIPPRKLLFLVGNKPQSKFIVFAWRCPPAHVKRKCSSCMGLELEIGVVGMSLLGGPSIHVERKFAKSEIA